jgi:hypothetical protein
MKFDFVRVCVCWKGWVYILWVNVSSWSFVFSVLRGRAVV